MPEQLQRNFSLDVQEKLYEKNSPHGLLAIYQTSSFGMIVTLNGRIIITERDGFFYHEMMTHPALFTHPHPQKIAIIGNCFGLLHEVLKHSSVTEVICVTDNESLEHVVTQYFSPQYLCKNDPRVRHHSATPLEWLANSEAESFDLIIQSQASGDFLQENYKSYHHALRPDGILIQPCQLSLLHLKTLKPIFQNIKQAEFMDWSCLNFPQPNFPSGWRTIMMATRRPTFKRIREKDIYNRSFATRYYNFDTHKAALAQPEFMREDIEGLD